MVAAQGFILKCLDITSLHEHWARDGPSCMCAPTSACRSSQGTYYGANQDDAGSCGYGPAFANSLGLDWSQGLDNYIALNAAQYYGGAGCGLCVMYR